MTQTSDQSAATTAALVTPVAGAELRDSFGAPRPGGRSHEGIDIFADRGTPIQAISGGTVVNGFGNDLGGKVVWVDGDDGRLYYYAHLDEIGALELGDRVETGAVIGTVGTSGNAATTPPHLHLQIKEDGEWINPFTFLEDLAPAEAVGVAYVVDEGVPPLAADGDGDGLTDEFEALLGTDPADSDSDDDGLSDLHETTVSHTDPLLADTDADGVPDAAEVAAGTDPGTGQLPQAAVDRGFGGLATRDSDADGLSDEYEIAHGLDPHSADSDADTLPDALEVALGSNPLSMDTDSDGVTDAAEYELGTLTPMELPLGQPLDGAHPFEEQTLGGHSHSHPEPEPVDALAGATDDDAGTDVG
jgi:Peptidase family M23/Bacterial TSP3 repeat